MDSKKTAEILKEIREHLPDEQKEKTKDCKTADELVSLLSELGVDLPDELLEAVSGGVQAGIFTTGGSGEFGPSHPDPEEQKPHYPTWF